MQPRADDLLADLHVAIENFAEETDLFHDAFEDMDIARGTIGGDQAEFGITTPYVTHDQTEALSISDSIAVMSAGHLVDIIRSGRLGFGR